jgi:uncharacterized protein (DUF1684 family)
MDEQISGYIEEIAAWRAAAEAALRAPEGWLSVAGLFWLNEGVNRVGSDPQYEIALPAGAPAFAGEICLRDGAVTIGVAGPHMLLNGEPPDERALRSDMEPPPDRISIGRLALQILRRGQRLGVRVRDPEGPALRAFAGRRWYAVRPEYRIVADFEAYDPPRPIAITSILGDTEDKLSPGAAIFQLDGQQLRLEAVPSANGTLFFNFRDRTAGETTYGAGRFLYSAAPQKGKLVLDFNQAVSPPCAFTPYATCPLPPPQNRLPLPIPAGEQYTETTH